MDIFFKSMELFDENNSNSVRIIGDSSGKKVEIEMSILQLAVIFDTDKNVISLMKQSGGFGSHELELKCTETKELVKKYPEITFSNNQLISSKDCCFIPYTKDGDEDYGRIIFEDLSGWGNEGISIILPMSLYNLFKDEYLKIVITQKEMKINLFNQV